MSLTMAMTVTSTMLLTMTRTIDSLLGIVIICIVILSVVGMGLAAAGYLPPVTGAIAQELIDVFAVLNALRASIAPSSLTDMN